MPAKLDHFQSLATTVAVMERSAKVLSKAAPAETSLNQRAAWAALIRPQRVVNLTMQPLNMAGVDITYFGPQSIANGQHVHSRFLPLLSDHDCSLLAAGIADCAAQVRAAAQSEAFAAAAALQAPLIVAPGGAPEAPELAYPLMGLSLKAGRTTIDNKRADTLVAHVLFRAGDINFSGNPRHYQNGHRIAAGDWLGADQPPTAVAALDTARKAAPPLEHELGNQYLRFGAALHSGEPPELSADLPLPCVALIRDRSKNSDLLAQRQSASPSFGKDKENLSRAELAPRKAVQAGLAIQAAGALSALSLIFGAAEDRLGARRFEGPNRISSLPLGLAQSRASAKLLGVNYFETGMMYVGPGNNQPYFDLGRRQHDAASEQTDEQVDALIAPLLQAPQDLSTVVSFGENGVGLMGLSNTLAQADPRFGLMQWGISLCHFGNAQVDDALAYLAPARAGLLKALVELKAATELAQSVFLQHALRAAEAVEFDWMNERGLLPAWRQAHSSGALSARSIAWARLNPASALLDSQNPMEALGARCAKAWGLRVGEPADPGFLEAFRQAMSERGAQQAAWNAFAQNADLRERLAQLIGATAVVEKPVAQTSRGALAFYLRAVERSAAMGMEPQEINRFTRAYIEPDFVGSEYQRQQHKNLAFAQRLGALKFFAASAPLGAGSWDGLAPGLGFARLCDGPTASLVNDLGAGKSAQYDAMLDALAQDWADTVSSCVAHGQPAASSEAVARARASEIAHAFPANGSHAFDWRSPVFSDAPVWRVLGLPSPRYSAAADAAPAQGPLGVWCASLARDLDIRDAQDGNDLIGKTRDAVKRRTGITDGAWRQLIKQPDALAYLRAEMNAKASAVPLERRLGDGEQRAIDVARVGGSYAPSVSTEARARDAGRLFSMASALNLPIDKALRAARALPAELFGSTIGALDLAGVEGAQFYITELQAKLDRAPHILKEAIKRLEKLDKDADVPAEPGQVRQNAVQAFCAETTDLADWIKNSEPGLWQELPAAPTWNQLRRFSQQWHDEQAAIARDKNERRQAKEAREAANEVMLHAQDAAMGPDGSIKLGARHLMGEFANPSGSAWPKALGRYARDGWEAVELLTASQLTEEGASMSHCVSSYSAQCRSGQTRIFSVRLNGERVCTLQISGPEPLAKLDEKASFRIAQNRGKHNAAITSVAALKFCEETLDAFAASWRSICVKRRDLIEAEIARRKTEKLGEGTSKPRARKAPKAG